MICPWCGANVAAKKFCENCGGSLQDVAANDFANPQPDAFNVDKANVEASAIPGYQTAQPVEQPFQPAAQPYQSAQPAQPAQIPYQQASQNAGQPGQAGFQPQFDQPAATGPAQPWYAKTWVIVVLLLFFWPAGLALMWMKTCEWSKTVKIVVTAVIAVLFLYNMTAIVGS